MFRLRLDQRKAALAILSSDALASLAYATQEIVLVLGLAHGDREVLEAGVQNLLMRRNHHVSAGTLGRALKQGVR